MEEKEIKEAMIEALTHLEGCKYFVATIVNEEMMMMDVLQWCSERFKNSIEKGKKSTN